VTGGAAFMHRLAGGVAVREGGRRGEHEPEQQARPRPATRVRARAQERPGSPA
jgi:hypothetical protein